MRCNLSGAPGLPSKRFIEATDSIEAALDVAQLGEEVERLLAAGGITGGGAQHGDRAAQPFDLQAPVYPVTRRGAIG
jgi:hypothetical protein